MSVREHRCCWHQVGRTAEASVSVYHCCREGCADVTVCEPPMIVEEKTHGYLKGWRPLPNGCMEPPRLRVVRPR